MIKILRKEGFILNPEDRVVNTLFQMIDKNGGKCPCSGNKSEDLNCPCSDYRENNHCCCGLYKQIN